MATNKKKSGWSKQRLAKFQATLKSKKVKAIISNIKEIPAPDPVNHPAHYTSGKIEVLDFIEDQKLGFHPGQVIKYVARAGKKTPGLAGTLEDLKKGQFYLNRYIANLEKDGHE